MNNIYGEPDDLAIGKISKEILDDIKSNFCGEKVFLNSNKYMESSNDIHPILCMTKHEINIINEIKKNLVVGNMHEYDYSNETIKKLHDELRKIFSVHIRSPFIFVNTRIWKTKPNSATYGSNAMHTDGFMPGHLKIMIYLTPLNEDYGTFIYKKKNQEIHNINDRSEGTAILFRNSDIMHRGKAGKIYERISIECTLMTSIINGNQNWPGHWWGRHFKHLNQIKNY